MIFPSRHLLVFATGLFAVAGGASWLSAQTCREVRGAAPIASGPVLSQHQTPTTKQLPPEAKDSAAPACIAASSSQGSPVPPAPNSDYQAGEQTRIAYMEAEVSRQEIDPVWSSQAEAQLQKAAEKALQGVGPETRILFSTCRKTFCRLEMVHPDDPGVMTSFIDEFVSHLDWSATVLQHSPGNLTTVIYLSREGHNLPSRAK